jgi:hypothetical protein
MPIDVDGIDSEGTNAFLKTLLPPEEDAEKEPSKKVKEEPKEPVEPEDSEDDVEDEETPPEDEESEEEPEAKKPTKKFADDDVFVKIKVGDEEHEVSVKDLRRLHGQEAALTRKSQAVAEQTKAIDDQRIKYAAKLDAMVGKATAKANQYRQVNLLALSKDPTVSAEMLNALQTEARQAFEEEAYLRGEQNEFIQDMRRQQSDRLLKIAQETNRVFSDESSPMHIEGWGKKLYEEMREFAIEQGISREQVDQLVDAPALKILHQALMFHKGSQKTATRVINKSPKKIVKTGVAPRIKPPSKRKAEAASKDHRDKGTIDSAANAFMARWDSGDTE